MLQMTVSSDANHGGYGSSQSENQGRIQIMRRDGKVQVCFPVMFYSGYTATSISGDLSGKCESGRTEVISRTKSM